MNDSIRSVRDAILIGLVLASIILVLFLRDWGTSLVAGLVIPATIAVTFIGLRVLGESFNLMTLGGLAAAVGLVIDDAIVVVENIVMHRDAGQSRAEAIRSALGEIDEAADRLDHHADRRVSAADLDHRRDGRVLPRAGADGGDGAADVACVLALTWTPTLSHYLLRTAQAARRRAGDGSFGRCAARVRPVLRAAIARPSAAWLRGSWRLIGGIVSSPTAHLGSDLLPRWTKADSFSTTSCRRARRSRRRIGRCRKWSDSRGRFPKWRTRRGGRDSQLGLAQVTEANTGDIACG